jgi:hypothetical protein
MLFLSVGSSVIGFGIGAAITLLKASIFGSDKFSLAAAAITYGIDP